MVSIKVTGFNKDYPFFLQMFTLLYIVHTLNILNTAYTVKLDNISATLM
jgi:hypothetical protein